MMLAHWIGKVIVGFLLYVMLWHTGGCALLDQGGFTLGVPTHPALLTEEHDIDITIKSPLLESWLNKGAGGKTAALDLEPPVRRAAWQQPVGWRPPPNVENADVLWRGNVTVYRRHADAVGVGEGLTTGR